MWILASALTLFLRQHLTMWPRLAWNSPGSFHVDLDGPKVLESCLKDIKGEHASALA